MTLGQAKLFNRYILRVLSLFGGQRKPHKRGRFMVGRSLRGRTRSCLIFGLCSLSWCLLAVPSSADVLPGKNDRSVTKIVLDLLNREHLLRRPMDDEISQLSLIHI